MRISVTRMHRCAAEGLLLVLTHALVPADLQGQTSQADSSSPVTIHGSVDTYYSHNFARPQSRMNRLTNFDLAESQFTLSAAEVDIARSATPAGFRIEVATGAAPDMVNSGAESAMIFQQAYLTVIVPIAAGVTVDAGKFFTHMGFESAKAKDNFNYSRSLLFAWPIPYYHTGVRATYPVADNVSASVFFSNGWNGSIANTGKTFGASVGFTPVAPLSVLVNWLGGPQESDTVSSAFRHVFEALATLKVSDVITLGCDGVYGREHISAATLTWGGVAVYARAAMSATSALSLRGEVYNDPDGFTTGIVQDLKEVTLTYERLLFSSLILRAEYRYDASTARPFDGSDGNGTRKDQSRVAIACIVTF